MLSIKKNTMRFWLVLGFLFLLNGCGGGSSTNDSETTPNPTAPSPTAPTPTNQAPTIENIPSQTVDEGTLVTLSVNASDLEGAITHQWVQISDFNVPINGETSDTITFTAPSVNQELVLTFQYTATDSDNLSTSTTVDITVKDTKTPLMVNAGLNQTVTESDFVELIGEVTTSDGELITYQWEQIGGDLVVLNDSERLVASFIAPSVIKVTELIFRLTVTDNQQSTASSQVTITVLPQSAQTILGAGAHAPGFEEGAIVEHISEVHFGKGGHYSIEGTVRVNGSRLNALWHGFNKQIQLVAVENQALPSLPSNILLSRFETLGVTDNGNILIEATTKGAETTKVILLFNDNIIKLVMREEQTAPGIPENMMIRYVSSQATNAGVVIMTMFIDAPTRSLALGRATYLWKDGDLSLIAGAYLPTRNSDFEDSVSLPEGGIGVYPETCQFFALSGAGIPVMNNSGTIVMSTTIDSEIDTEACPGYAFLMWKDGTWSVVVENGEMIPNMDNNIFTLSELSSIFPYPLSSFNVLDNDDVLLSTATNRGFGVSNFSLFVKKANGDLRLLGFNGETIKQRPDTNIRYGAACPSCIFAVKNDQYILSATDFANSEAILLKGNAINNPYEEFSELSDTHLDLVLRQGTLPPGESTTAYFTLVDRIFPSSGQTLANGYANRVGDFVFYGRKEDTVRPENNANGFWMIEPSGAITETFIQRDTVFNELTGDFEEFLSASNFVLTDEKQLIVFGDLNISRNIIFSVNTSD